MTVTVGRFTAQDLDTYTQTGDSLDISGLWYPSSGGDTDAAQAARLQLLGLREGDTVPLTVTDAVDDLDGFYRVASPATVTPHSTVATTGFFDYSIGLQRVDGGIHTGTFEVTSTAGLRSNNNSVTDWSREVFWPASALWSSLTAASADSTRQDCVGTHDSSPTAGTERFRYVIGPGDYYEGAAVIELKIGSTWYPMVGHHLPAGTVADAVRVGNAQFRFVLEEVSTTVAWWMDCYNGSSWETDEARLNVANDGDGPDDASPVVILRNDPAEVAVRYYVIESAGGFSNGGTTVDVVVRRGAVGVEGALAGGAATSSLTTDQTGAVNNDYGVVQSSPSAGDPAYYLVTDDVTIRGASSITFGQTHNKAFAGGFSRIDNTDAQQGHDAFYGSNATSQRLVLP